jgi:hypothetical protein
VTALIVRLPLVPIAERTSRNGLSRMKGNFQVRFLEGGAGWQQPASTRRCSV